MPTQPKTWFLHFHKCAGTLFISTAKNAGFTFYKNDLNGNPAEDGKAINIWTMDPKALKKWIRVNANGCNLIATEWGVPDLETVKESDFQIVTILREPWTRFTSNFRYDVSNSFTKASSASEYSQSGNIWTSHNYYTRMLSRTSDPHEKLNESHLQKAVENLNRIDKILIQESGNLTKRIANVLACPSLPDVVNKTRTFDVGNAFRTLKGGNIANILNSIKLSIKKPDLDYKNQSWFTKENTLDYAIYKAACEREQ